MRNNVVLQSCGGHLNSVLIQSHFTWQLPVVTSCRLMYRTNVIDFTGRLYKRRGIPAGNCKRQLSDKIMAVHLRRVRDVTIGHLPLNSLINET